MKKTTDNNLSQKYSKGTIAIHWITTVLILALFPMGKYMEGLETADKMGLIRLHAILGLAVFVLTLIRTWLFFKSPRPEHVRTGSAFNDKLIVWVHNGFYVLLFAISLSGIATLVLGGYVEGLQSANSDLIKDHNDIAPLNAHGLLAVFMMVLLLAHVFGVLKHYLATKENTLNRVS